MADLVSSCADLEAALRALRAPTEDTVLVAVGSHADAEHGEFVSVTVRRGAKEGFASADSLFDALVIARAKAA
jgi:hypothetical protein